MNESVLYLCMCVLVGVVDVSVGWVLFLRGRGFLSGVGKVLSGLWWVLWCSDGIKQTPWNHYHQESRLIDTKQKKQNLHIPFNSRSIIFLTCLLQFPPPYLQITIYHTGVNKAPTFDLALPLESRVQHRHFPASSLCKSTSNKPPSVSPTFTKRSLSSVYTISLLIYFFLSLTAFFFFYFKMQFRQKPVACQSSYAGSLSNLSIKQLFLFFSFTGCSELDIRLKGCLIALDTAVSPLASNADISPSLTGVRIMCLFCPFLCFITLVQYVWCIKSSP